ncbi:MAG: ABC transporter permease, partial [Rhodospirillales bacterium]
MTLTLVAPATSDQATGKRRPWWRRHLSIVIGGLLLALMVAVALAAPFLGTVDPAALSPIRRLRMPSEQYWFGTD